MLGTAKARQEVQPPDDAHELAKAVLRDLGDREVRLGDTWEERPAVLVFLRHYG
jgi:hypothetical protein